MYIYICNIPLNNNPPNKKKKRNSGKINIVYHKFRRRHDYPLIKNDVWFDRPPS